MKKETEKITLELIKKIYKPRAKDSFKYDSGLLVIIGGSDFYSGSPALSAMAAFRAGIDMVRIIAPQRAADIIASFNPDLAAYPLEGKWLEKQHLATLISMTESAKAVARGNVAVVIGGGIGRSEETQETIREFISQISVPVVIDADAIYAIKDKREILSGKQCLITPHYYEFFSLSDRDVYELSLEEKIKAVEEEAKNIGATLLLKGAIDIVSDGKKTGINELGSPYLSVGGCGDTLAGIAGALMARKFDAYESGLVAARINSSAGILAADKLKDAMTATDLIDKISDAINKDK